jgi:hypothetical protein
MWKNVEVFLFSFPSFPLRIDYIFNLIQNVLKIKQFDGSEYEGMRGVEACPRI